MFSLTRDKIVSVLKGAAIAAAGAALTYLGDFATGGSLGEFGPAVAAVLAVVVNLVRKMASPE